jgi:hypothetical protein
VNGRVFTADLGLGQLPDRYLAAKLRRIAAARRAEAGDEDQAAATVDQLADAVRRADQPGQVEVHLDRDGMAGVTAALAAGVDQARAGRDSATLRLLRIYDEWAAFALRG